ncbi:MAG: TetR/AcrR family transcriptional regulator [Oscillospiraceae bacterium]
MARNSHPEETVKRILEVSMRLFKEKGYEQTTIADIVSELGDLSKGAIYHHFKSKEEIIVAASEEHGRDLEREISILNTNSELNGLQKIRYLFHMSINSDKQERIISAVPNLLQNPRFLAEELHTGNKYVAPIIEKFIHEGIADGSIIANQPKQTAEVLILLADIWVNPLVFVCDKAEFHDKCIFLMELCKKLGVPVFDQEMFTRIEYLHQLANSYR